MIDPYDRPTPDGWTVRSALEAMDRRAAVDLVDSGCGSDAGRALRIAGLGGRAKAVRFGRNGAAQA